MTTRSRLRWLLVGLVTMVVASGCSGGTATPPSQAPSSATPSAVPHPTQLEIWHDAYAFLAAQTTPVEVVCGQFRTERGHTTVTPMRIWLVAFTDRSIHSLFLTGADTPPRPQYFKCRVNVPGSVPYRRPAINRFLARHGFVEGKRRADAPRLVPTEIEYPQGVDSIYRDKPGLFALAIALQRLAAGGGIPYESSHDRHVFEPGTHSIIQPTNDTQAALYERMAGPVLAWYGHLLCTEGPAAVRHAHTLYPSYFIGGDDSCS